MVRADPPARSVPAPGANAAYRDRDHGNGRRYLTVRSARSLVQPVAAMREAVTAVPSTHDPAKTGIDLKVRDAPRTSSTMAPTGTSAVANTIAASITDA